MVLKLTPAEGRESKIRSTTEEVYAQIESDLQEAAALLDTGFNRSVHNTAYQGRATKDAAWGYLAKVYFQKGTLTDLAKAKEAVDKAIGSTSGMSEYPLEPLTTVNKPMNKTGYQKSSGTIFQIINREDNSTSANLLSRYQSANGGEAQYVTTNIISGLYIDASAVISGKVICSSSSAATDLRTGYVTKAINKFQNENTNIPRVRAAELMLIRAEANAWINNNVAAIQDLRKVRGRSLNGVCDGSSAIDSYDRENLIQQIRREYFREMAFEGIFLHEFRRRNVLDVVTTNNYEPDETNDEATEGRISARFVEEVPWNSYQLVVPIPDNELANNSAIQQTLGW